MELIHLCLNEQECPGAFIIYNPCDKMRPIVGVGKGHVVAVKDDGKVYLSGLNDHQQCDVSAWKDIKMIAAYGNHTIGLTNQGYVIATGDISPFHFEGWDNITWIATGLYHVVGLRPDGSVTATGYNVSGQCDIYKWFDVIAVYAGMY